jgi:hypothetical protein
MARGIMVPPHDLIVPDAREIIKNGASPSF